jgi:phosphoglycolate phosphatase-like HAD superfamily hydrolase
MTAVILFDIDGTLIRAGTDVHKAAFAHAFREVYGVETSLDGVRPAGRTDTWLLYEPLRMAGLNDQEITDRMPRAFELMCRYVDFHLDDLRDKVLPGIPEVLDELCARGAVIGLLTGNLEPIAMAKMRKAGLQGRFDFGAFGEESATRSELVPVALGKARVSAAQAVVVGDTPLDIEAAMVHGVRSCGVATGPFDEEELREAGADLVVSSLAPGREVAGRIMDLVAARS